MTSPTFRVLSSRVLRPAVALLSSLMLSVGHAAEPTETYAVLALVGDDMTVVTHRPTVGSNLDTNAHAQVPNADDHFDRLAVQAAGNAIRNAVAGAAVERVEITDPALVGSMHAGLTEAALPALLDAIKGRLKRADTHYLVVVGRFRGDARLHLANGTIGSGYLSGLGFYLDYDHRMRRTDTREAGRGFIAPFAYVAISLVDLRTGAIVRSESATESATIANAGENTTLDPWQAMTAERKVRALDGLLRRAVVSTVPRVVAPG